MTEKPFTDSSIVDAQYHTHQPATTVYNHNDEIRISVEGDRPTLPSESYILISGFVLKEDGNVSSTAGFVNNGLAHLFSEIRYEINGITVDSVSKAGIASTIKGLLSYTPNQVTRLQNAGWKPDGETDKLPRTKTGQFSVCLPLSMLLGFAEDYKKVILNIRQELVLIRSSDDSNAIYNSAATGATPEVCNIRIDKIQWRIPHIVGSLQTELAMAKYMDKNVDTTLRFRSWELHTKTGLPTTKLHSWNIKSVKKSHSPLYVILAFQTNRDGMQGKDTSKFDHCKIKNMNVFLNSVKYPYDNFNADFDNHQYCNLYENYSNFQRSYYNIEPEPLLNVEKFKTSNPMVVIDCSKQPENIAFQNQTINVLLEFETIDNLPDGVVAYCLLIYERQIAYNALTKYVKHL